MTAREDASDVVAYLRPWALGDPDGFPDAIEHINQEGNNLMKELAEAEGDARGMMETLPAEIAELQGLVRGAMFLAREAIDLLLDQATSIPATNRAEALTYLVGNR